MCVHIFIFLNSIVVVFEIQVTNSQWTNASGETDFSPNWRNWCARTFIYAMPMLYCDDQMGLQVTQYTIFSFKGKKYIHTIQVEEHCIYYIVRHIPYQNGDLQKNSHDWKLWWVKHRNPTTTTSANIIFGKRN